MWWEHRLGKPYSCSVCGRGDFVGSSSYQKHVSDCLKSTGRSTSYGPRVKRGEVRSVAAVEPQLSLTIHEDTELELDDLEQNGGVEPVDGEEETQEVEELKEEEGEGVELDEEELAKLVREAMSGTIDGEASLYIDVVAPDGRVVTSSKSKSNRKNSQYIDW